MVWTPLKRLREEVTNIVICQNLYRINNPSGNTLPHLMIRNSQMLLLAFRINHRTALQHPLVIPIHVRPPLNRYTQAPKHIPQRYSFLACRLSGHEFSAIARCLDGGLALTRP